MDLENVKTILKDSWDTIVPMVITNIVTLLTVFFSIRYTNKNHLQAIEQQSEIFNDTVKAQAEMSKELSGNEDFRNAQTMKPFFRVKVKNAELRDDKHLFFFEITNVGNGIATGLRIMPYNGPSITEVFYGDKKVPYYMNDIFREDIAGIGEKQEFSLTCEQHIGECWLKVKISFEDIMERTYEQELQVLYCFKRKFTAHRYINNAPIYVRSIKSGSDLSYLARNIIRKQD